MHVEISSIHHTYIAMRVFISAALPQIYLHPWDKTVKIDNDSTSATFICMAYQASYYFWQKKLVRFHPMQWGLKVVISHCITSYSLIVVNINVWLEMSMEKFILTMLCLLLKVNIILKQLKLKYIFSSSSCGKYCIRKRNNYQQQRGVYWIFLLCLRCGS